MQNKHKAMASTLGLGIVGAVWLLTPAAYPAHTLPPPGWGVANPAITQENINQTICNPKWSTTSIRPPSSLTTSIKREQLASMRYSDRTTSAYEEDHVISLELGGDPTDPRNLWPQPYENKVGGLNLGAREKDRLENWLHGMVCSPTGIMTLRQAQDAVRGDWTRWWAKMKGYDVPESDTDD